MLIRDLVNLVGGRIGMRDKVRLTLPIWRRQFDNFAFTHGALIAASMLMTKFIPMPELVLPMACSIGQAASCQPCR